MLNDISTKIDSVAPDEATGIEIKLKDVTSKMILQVNFKNDIKESYNI